MLPKRDDKFFPCFSIPANAGRIDSHVKKSVGARHVVASDGSPSHPDYNGDHGFFLGAAVCLPAEDEAHLAC